MKTYLKFAALGLSAALLAACSSSNDDPAPAPTPAPPPPPADAQFEVRVINLTNAQPLSPVAVIMHRSGFNNFIDGETASEAVELLAEGGDNSDVLEAAEAADQHIVSGSTEGPIGPRSGTDTPVALDVPNDQLANLRLSVMTMLVHTNDAFTGLNAMNISNMAVDERRILNAPVWDAGTELDNELATAMPGPDFGGEGFNATRDDRIDRVRFHNGVVTSASDTFGLPTSALGEQHRFLNPASRIIVTRVR